MAHFFSPLNWSLLPWKRSLGAAAISVLVVASVDTLFGGGTAVEYLILGPLLRPSVYLLSATMFCWLPYLVLVPIVFRRVGTSQKSAVYRLVVIGWAVFMLLLTFIEV